MFIPIWGLILLILAAGVIGAFIYRNNVKEYSPYADKIDELWDRLEAKIEAKLKEIKEDNKTV